jgi:hypothetical protein
VAVKNAFKMEYAMDFIISEFWRDIGEAII